MIAGVGEDGGLGRVIDALMERCRLPSGEIRQVKPCGAGGQLLGYRVDLRDGSSWCLKREKSPGTTVHLRREGRFLGLVRSRHVPRLVLDASAEGFVVEEWIEGIPFERAEASCLRASLDRIVQGLAQLLVDLSAVAPAVIHRDIKPRNLLLRQGEPVLLDFGSAEHEGSRDPDAPVRPGKLGRGTHVFQPLEQLLARPTQDRRVDVFAAAGVVFWILTGSPPFDNSRSDAAEALRFYRSLEREVETLLAGWPAPFREALTGALRVDPKARSSDLADLVRSMAGLRP